MRYEPRLLRLVDVRKGSTIPFKDKDGKLPKVTKEEEKDKEEATPPMDLRFVSRFQSVLLGTTSVLSLIRYLLLMLNEVVLLYYRGRNSRR